ncbi:hypothetical protein AAF712_007514 [Marasmius tenuissimus]|uniref:Uncharacterized protein n=1 Tax=Marasmius tenuissimus TaxID=585030 RepID=A0ABR2ZVW6_9AGAR
MQQTHQVDTNPPGGDSATSQLHGDKDRTNGDFERRRSILAHYQAPLNIAEASSGMIHAKYDGDYHTLLDSARRTIQPPRQYPIPGDDHNNQVSFAELVVHVFVHCASEYPRQLENRFSNARLPSSTSWPSIFPAYSALKSYEDAITQRPSRLSLETRYLKETNSPGITSAFVLPFLSMLTERKRDPLVVLAVHMQILHYVRYIWAEPLLRTPWDSGTVAKEEMEEFLGSEEIREWFDSRPDGGRLREECERIVREMELETKENARVRAESIAKEYEIAQSERIFGRSV